MKNIEEIKAKCDIILHDGSKIQEHWLWNGSYRANRKGKKTVCCSAPDYTKDPTGATNTIQTVMRAIRHLVTKKPIRKGWEAYRTCAIDNCISPDCTKWMTRKQRGEHIKASGSWCGNLKRNIKSVAVRWSPDKRKITPDLHSRIMSDPMPAVHLGPILGLHHTTVSWVRRGKFQGAGDTKNPYLALVK